MLVGARLPDAVRAVESWRQSFRTPGLGDPDPLLRATLSAGVAEWHLGESAAELFTRADGALYAAKDGGRDRVIRAAQGRSLPIAPPQRRAVSRPFED